MGSPIQVTLRDILCASLSLDDALSAIQNAGAADPENAETLYGLARALEEIILRRPGLASTKFMELTVRLSFGQDPIMPELVMLLDTRYTSAYRRAESELLPDLKALPQLLDVLGELSQATDTALRLNLRPLVTFLTDEILLTLEAVFNRFHEPATTLALHEVHYLTFSLVNEALFDCAEALLNRLLAVARQMKLESLVYQLAFDEACVLTELGMFEESRMMLEELESSARLNGDTRRLAQIALQLSLNDTRDDGIPYEAARVLADKAARMYREGVGSGTWAGSDLALALLDIGSNILVTGWREAVHQAIGWLRDSSDAYQGLQDMNTNQSFFQYKCFAALGLAYGLIGDHDSIVRAVDYLHGAKSIIERLEKSGLDCGPESSRCDHALGWICLWTDSNEFWSAGIEAFKRAIKAREDLLAKAGISELELIGSRIGLALSLMRTSDESDPVAQELLRDALAQYTRLFPTDRRAYTEVAIATYNTVWLSLRHGSAVPTRLLRLLDDVDRMLSDAVPSEDNIFIEGASLVIPYVSSSWNQLSRRARRMIDNRSDLSGIASVMMGLATAKINAQAVSPESGLRVLSPIDDMVRLADPLLAQYWDAQTQLARTVRLFYEHKSFSELASGLHDAAVSMSQVESTESPFEEASEFIRAVSSSFSGMLLRFAAALDRQYGTVMDPSKVPSEPEISAEGQYSFILAEDWTNLGKITDSYLQMVEQADLSKALPYLNATFSNITRTFLMMDSAAMVDRRVVAFLGEEMNRRFYLRP